MAVEPSALHALLLLLLAQLGDVESGFETRELLDFAIAAFALVLLAITLSAYRKTKLRRLILVCGAFGLFALEIVIGQLDDLVFEVGYQTDQVVSAVMDFVILLLFFLAVVVRD